MKLVTREASRNSGSCFFELSWIEINHRQYPIYGDLPWSDEKLQAMFTEADFLDILGPDVTGFVVRRKGLNSIVRRP
jgi:hypothetical protein